MPSSSPSAISDLQILRRFYESANGEKWTTKKWDITLDDHCDFDGVSCNGEFEVTEIDLGKNNLSGSISSEIGKLNQLVTLDLGRNKLSGSISSEIGKLNQLVTFKLNGNKISETIPTQIGQLNKLEFIRLDGNSISGTIPTEIGQLANLKKLRMEDNDLTGDITMMFGDLSNLRNLDLANNVDLMGEFPDELCGIKYDIKGTDILDQCPTS